MNDDEIMKWIENRDRQQRFYQTQMHKFNELEKQKCLKVTEKFFENENSYRQKAKERLLDKGEYR